MVNFLAVGDSLSRQVGTAGSSIDLCTFRSILDLLHFRVES